MTLLILAAGMGSRFGGPKQFFPLGPNGECLFHYSIYDALRHGAERIVLVTREEIIHQAQDAVRSVPAPVEIVLQECPSGKPLGTAHAVSSSLDALEDEIAIAINADDYYGSDAFAAAERLGEREPEAAAVPYRLEGTLSDKGGVSRGICEIENDRLVGIIETYEVQRVGNTIEGIQKGTRVPIAPGATASMNMFLFRRDLIADMAAYVASERKYGPPGELTIPDFLQDRIRSRNLEVPVELTDSEWFGLTFADDLDKVRARLAELHESGELPPRLW